MQWMLENEQKTFEGSFWISLRAEDGSTFYFNPFTDEFATDLPFIQKSGGFLAAGVGTGKTPTALHVILRSKQNGPSLIVVPVSLLQQWKDELTKYTPDLRVISYHNAKDKQKAELKDLQEADVVLTTYSSLTKGQPTAAYADFTKKQRR